MQAQVDKLIIDLSDDEKLAEFVSRLEPGDCAEITCRAYLDDSVNKTATFSIRGVKCKNMPAEEEGEGTDETEGTKEGDGKTDEGDAMDKPAVMEWADRDKAAA